MNFKLITFINLLLINNTNSYTTNNEDEYVFARSYLRGNVRNLAKKKTGEGTKRKRKEKKSENVTHTTNDTTTNSNHTVVLHDCTNSTLISTNNSTDHYTTNSTTHYHQLNCTDASDGTSDGSANTNTTIDGSNGNNNVDSNNNNSNIGVGVGGPEINVKGPWPECLGLSADECQSIIQTARPDLFIEVLGPDMFGTTDWRLDRARIYVDDDNVVIAPVPNIG